jgi:hypothetical protein
VLGLRQIHVVLEDALATLRKKSRDVTTASVLQYIGQDYTMATFSSTANPVELRKLLPGTGTEESYSGVIRCSLCKILLTDITVIKKRYTKGVPEKIVEDLRFI